MIEFLSEMNGVPEIKVIDGESATGDKLCLRRKSIREKILSGMPENGGKVKFGHKFALAIGAGPVTLPLITTTVYVQMFLLDVARVLPMYATLIIVIARILDALTDPTVGALVNKTQEKGGSLRKWMLSSLPIAIFSFFFLWYVPPTLEDEHLRFVYYLTVYTILQVAFTLYSIPFCSLVMYQSTDQSERDAATSYRLVGEALYAILALGIVRFAETITESGSLEEPSCTKNATVGKETLSRYHQTFMIQGGIGSSIILLAGMYCFLTSIENTDIHINSKIGVFKSFKNALTFKPYMFLSLAYLAGYVAVNITQGCLLLYFKYVIEKESVFTVTMLALVVSAALSIPVWKVLIGKYGKRKVSFCAVAITVPAFSMLSVITKQVPTPLLIAFAMFTGPGCACGYYIPWVLLPDVIDAYTVQYKQRNESLFYGFFVFLSKLAGGCVTGGTMLTLKLLNYDAARCEQNENVNLALRVICAACPTFLLILFGLIMYFFPINEQKMLENRKFLERTYFSHTSNDDLYVEGEVRKGGAHSRVPSGVSDGSSHSGVLSHSRGRRRTLSLIGQVELLQSKTSISPDPNTCQVDCTDAGSQVHNGSHKTLPPDDHQNPNAIPLSGSTVPLGAATTTVSSSHKCTPLRPIPAVRKKDYELLTARNSLPSIISLPTGAHMSKSIEFPIGSGAKRAASHHGRQHRRGLSDTNARC